VDQAQLDAFNEHSSLALLLRCRPRLTAAQPVRPANFFTQEFCVNLSEYT
jgi:hypothetical protein